MGDSLENISHAAEAEVNLVVSSVGLETAKVLKDKFGTPYVIGTPVGDFTEDICNDTGSGNKKYRPKEKITAKESISVVSDKPEIPYLQNRLSEPQEITLIGEAVTMGSLAAAIERKYHKAVRVICPLETNAGLLALNDRVAKGEGRSTGTFKRCKDYHCGSTVQTNLSEEQQFL